MTNWTVPLLAPGLTAADGQVFAGGEQDGLTGLFALDPGDGRRLCRFPAAIIGTPAVTGGVVYAVGPVNSSYQLYAIAAATGRQLWSQPADWSDTPVLADGDTVCLVSQSSDTLWVWAASTGKLLWTTDADGSVVSAAVAAGIVYAVTRNGSLLALEAASHTLLWRRPVGMAIRPWSRLAWSTPAAQATESWRAGQVTAASCGSRSPPFSLPVRPSQTAPCTSRAQAPSTRCAPDMLC